MKCLNLREFIRQSAVRQLKCLYSLGWAAPSPALAVQLQRAAGLFVPQQTVWLKGGAQLS